MMYFKKGLKHGELFHKLARKNPRSCKELFTIADKYTIAEEAILETQGSKKDKRSSHNDRSESSKSQDRKRKSVCEVTNVERSRLEVCVPSAGSTQDSRLL
jgi:hypothetical protein